MRPRGANARATRDVTDPQAGARFTWETQVIVNIAGGGPCVSVAQAYVSSG